MTDESIYEKTKAATGIDPDEIRFDGIISKNSGAWKLEKTYDGDMAPTHTRTLTAEDRCDMCSARAQGWAELESGAELFFCMHHLNASMEGLLSKGATVFSVEGLTD